MLPIITYNAFIGYNGEVLFMDKDYRTVEQISEMLNIHPKTIQRYIREGKLRAVKVGKSWRVSGHDLSVFIESNSVHNENSNAERKITASSVIDIESNGVEDAMRIINMLTSAMNAKPTDSSKTSMQSQYIERENMVRVTFWGDIRLMSVITEIIITITGGE
jgi:excisionase family DNA binding protein